jgi:hypothetical protein
MILIAELINHFVNGIVNMATVKKTVVKKATKKAQYGEYLSQDRTTGKYTLTTKANTPGGPRYYQSTSPNESTNRTINNFRIRANSADSVRAKDIDPAIIKRLAEQKNGGKTPKAKASKQMLKRKDGSVSQRGLWDNIRAAAKRNKVAGKPGKKPTVAMLKQEKKIKAKSK